MNVQDGTCKITYDCFYVHLVACKKTSIGMNVQEAICKNASVYMNVQDVISKNASEVKCLLEAIVEIVKEDFNAYTLGSFFVVEDSPSV